MNHRSVDSQDSQDSQERSQAKNGEICTTGPIAELESNDHPPRSMTSETTVSPNSYTLRGKPRYFPNGQMVTVQKVYNELKKKSRISINPTRPTSNTGMKLPGMPIARDKVNEFGGRDQIFVIDDCNPLRDYRENIAMTARVIGYTVKVTDTNGMDIFFSSASCSPQKCQSSSDVEKTIIGRHPVTGWCDMENCLRNVMKRVDHDGMKPTSIYIFTDGIWNPTKNNDGVKKIIDDAITSLIEKGKEPRHLMFQFVQFGHDENGYKRLDDLDKNCKRRYNGVVYDIVDRKYWDEDVPTIVVGSIDPSNDDDDESE
ncbi:serine threonine kinase [Fusarium longipes]|uniref:Serine threonine kinase n=1 Tax=Fusarium longipes TaxID=694270 RepID=A0A395SJU2_9HYPO|nr:serine threonine kinase [Fusarium longipes]